MNLERLLQQFNQICLVLEKEVVRQPEINVGALAMLPACGKSRAAAKNEGIVPADRIKALHQRGCCSGQEGPGRSRNGEDGHRGAQNSPRAIRRGQNPACHTPSDGRFSGQPAGLRA